MVNKKLKIVFFGTPEVATSFLRAAAKTEEVLCVFTQSDKPKGRKLVLSAPAVKTTALELSLPVYQPEKLSDDTVEIIKNFKPDVGVVVAYGKLIPKSVFTAPLYGCFNIHFSLLPKYRGAAPVQWALINGENKTGVSSFWLEQTLDSGPILAQKEMPILSEDSAKEVFEKLTTLGIEVMNETLNKIKNEQCVGKKQEGTITFAHSLKKADGFINWQKSAQEIYNLIRGTTPWPGVHTAILINGKEVVLKILSAEIFNEAIGVNIPCGQIIKIIPNHPSLRPALGWESSVNPVIQIQPSFRRTPESSVSPILQSGIVVACGVGALLIKTVHPANKVAIAADVFANNNKLNVGFVFEQYEKILNIFGGVK